MNEYLVYGMIIGCTIEFWLLAICLQQLSIYKRRIKKYEEKEVRDNTPSADTYTIHQKIISGLDGWGDFTAVFQVSAKFGDTTISKQQCDINKLTEEKKASMISSAEAVIEKCKTIL